MPVIPENVTRALKYWGNILGAARDGLSTQDLWNSIRAQQEQYGLDTPGASASEVSVLRGYANRFVNAANALESGAPGDSITADMMAIAPYTDRNYAAINTNPVYKVTFNNRIQLPNGDIVEKFQTSIFEGTDLPSTVGELQDTISFNAQQLAEAGSETSEGTPKGESLGVSQITITVV